MTEQKQRAQVIWGMGSYRSQYTHAYATKEAYERGECICGRKVVPTIQFDHWDINEKLAVEHTCQDCLKRMELYRYI